MTPRKYSMQGRSQQVAETRERIIEAATELFTVRGARATTMKEVARLADVSPATIGNHFATPDALLEAVVSRLLVEVHVPDAAIFEGARTLPERVHALASAMFDFYERTQRWYALLGDEISAVPAVARANAAFGRMAQQLYAEALTGSDDEQLAKIATGLIHPATLSALLDAGLSRDEAVDAVADAIAHRARRPDARPIS